MPGSPPQTSSCACGREQGELPRVHAEDRRDPAGRPARARDQPHRGEERDRVGLEAAVAGGLEQPEEAGLGQGLDRLGRHDPVVLGLLRPLPEHREQVGDRGDNRRLRPRVRAAFAHKLSLPEFRPRSPIATRLEHVLVYGYGWASDYRRRDAAGQVRARLALPWAGGRVPRRRPAAAARGAGVRHQAGRLRRRRRRAARARRVLPAHGRRPDHGHDQGRPGRLPVPRLALGRGRPVRGDPLRAAGAARPPALGPGSPWSRTGSCSSGTTRRETRRPTR